MSGDDDDWLSTVRGLRNVCPRTWLCADTRKRWHDDWGGAPKFRPPAEVDREERHAAAPLMRAALTGTTGTRGR